MPTTSGERALLVAARFGLAEHCARLLEEGSMDVNASDPTNKGGKTPLLLATEGGHLEAVHVLLAHQADVHTRCRVGKTALHIAVGRGNLPMAQELLAAQDVKRVVNAEDGSGEMPLHTAARDAHVGLVNLLLEAGANPTAQSSSLHPRTPLQEVLRRSDKPVERQRIRDVLSHFPHSMYMSMFKMTDNNHTNSTSNNVTATATLFERMVRSMRTVHDCKMIYTGLSVAFRMGLLSSSDSTDVFESVVLRAMEVCATCSAAGDMLSSIVSHASKQGGLCCGSSSKDLPALVECFREDLMDDDNDDDDRCISGMRDSIRKEIMSPHGTSLIGGISGDPKHLQQCLHYFQNQVAELSHYLAQGSDHPVDPGLVERSNLQILMGVMGVVANTLLSEGPGRMRTFRRSYMVPRTC
jgi:hypothetical protein